MHVNRLFRCILTSPQLRRLPYYIDAINYVTSWNIKVPIFRKIELIDLSREVQ